MTPLDRTSRQSPVRPPGRTRVPDQAGSLPTQTPRAKTPAARRLHAAALPVCEALEHTLWITTAASEDELASRTVQTAGLVTGATVACAVGPTGAGPIWGEPDLAAALL